MNNQVNNLSCVGLDLSKGWGTRGFPVEARTIGRSPEKGED